MKNLKTILLTAVTLAGCAAQPVAPPGGGDDDDDVPDDELPVPTTPEGRFAVTSQFDLATNAPGTAGAVANYFINATDDPEDPTKFLVDELIKALPDGSIKNAVAQAAPFVTGYLNDRLLEVAPDFVGKIIDVGDAFGQVTKNFGTNDVLEINAQGNAIKTVRGLHFRIDNVDMDFAFVDNGIQETKIENLQVTLDEGGKLTIAEHKVPLRYGQVLKIALDQAVIPMIDPSAQNLEDILLGSVNCQAVGQYVFEAIDFGSPSTFESACESGLRAASRALYNALDNIDSSALEFNMNGTARGVDRDSDGRMDDITTGTYTGTIGYAGSPAPLGDAKFFGKKM
jgi:hypothetical protein